MGHLIYKIYKILLFMFCFVRNSKFFSSFCSPVTNYLLAIRCRHPFSVAMLVDSFSVRRLKCSFHRNSIFLILFRSI